MTDRDRLKELLKQAQDKYFELYSEYARDSEGKTIESFEDFCADHLLANGVIVLPTRCKDCTYLRESETTNRIFCTYHGDSYEFETQPNDYCSNGVGLVKGV